MTSRLKRITIHAVEGLSPGDMIWDSELKGFGLRCQKRSKSYVLKTRYRGRQRFFTIGRHGHPWNPKTARDQAMSLLGQIASGQDPSEEARRQKAIPTIGELADEFLTNHVEPKLKPKTAEHYRSLVINYIKPSLGRLKVDEVATFHVERFHNDLSRTPFQANRTLAVLSKMFSWAEKHGHRGKGTNPVKGIERFEEKARDRFLIDAELSRVGDALDRLESKQTVSPFSIAAIRLLMFTGCRLNEVLSLKWQDVQLERGILVLQDSKTGKKPVHLNGAAIEVLKGIPKVVGNPHVIIGANEGQHFNNLGKVWRKVRMAAQLEPVVDANGGLQQVRLHDLRHTFASMAAAGGASLPMIGKLLGHTQAQTTARYAHLADDPLRKVNEEAGAAIAAAMSGRKNL